VRGIAILAGKEEFHTGDDLDLVQEEKKIGMPQTQSYTVEVPGRNGLLNLTKSLTGEVTYTNRELSFRFFCTGSFEHMQAAEQTLTRLHGETVRLIDDDTPEYYYEGELSFEVTERKLNYRIFTLQIDAQPFKTCLFATVLEENVKELREIYIDNEGVAVIPEITVSDSMRLTFRDSEFCLEKGTYQTDQIILQQGVNKFKLIGNGKIRFSFYEQKI